MLLPTGNGYYIWILDRCSKGDPELIADKAVRDGLGWVAIKIADSKWTFNEPKTVKATVDALHKRGISAWGWHYIYGYYPTQEADVAALQVDQLGLDGYIIDAEVEFKKDGRRAVASKFMDELKKRVTKPIGFTSYRFPTLHRDFPWKEFLPRVDFNMPQVYWMNAHNAGNQLRRSVIENNALYKSLGITQLPTIPLGAAFTEHGWNPTAAEILEFRKVSVELGFTNYGWWEWYFAETRNPVWWTASVQKIITGEPTTPEIPTEPTKVSKRVTTLYNDLRIRTGPSTSSPQVGFMEAHKVYTIVEQSGDWGRIDTPDTRWVHLGYCDAVSRVVTHYNNLRIRSGPSLNSAQVGIMSTNTAYDVTETRGVWGRFDGARERWVHLSYTTKI